jgi:hypothetical protein
MIEFITRGAHQLDAWLHRHVGRSYTAILGAGLVFGIIASVRGLGHAMGSSTSVLRILATVVFQLALLVNQLGQFHDYRQERRQRREARRRPPEGEA